MGLTERIKQAYREVRLKRQHRKYLETKMEDLVDPTLLKRMSEDE